MHPLRIILMCALAVMAGCSKDSETKPASPQGPRVAAPEDLLRGKDGLMYFRNELMPYTGFMRAQHPDGSPRVEFPHTRGVLNGRLRKWHPNGQLQLDAHYTHGLPHGNWDEWEAGGLHTLHRVFANGKLMHEEVPREFTERVEAVAREREQLDQTIWREETVAQEVEEIIVDLWDKLRAAQNKFEPLRKFNFKHLTLPDKGSVTELDWGIRIHQLSAGTDPLDAAAWRAWLAAKAAEGWRVVETEWHQEKFSLGEGEADRPESLFKIVIHAQREEHRAIIRGALQIFWKKVDGNFVADTMALQSARVLERRGAAPFQTQQEIMPQTDRKGVTAPTIVQDLNADGLPEIVLPGANEVYWNRGGWKFERRPMTTNAIGQLSAGVCADFNGDGRLDLLGLPKQGQPVLLAGDGKGRFGKPAGVLAEPLADMNNASAATAGDVDGDGDLDVWLMQYKFPYVRGQFPTPYYNANDGHPSYLLLNDGQGRFTEATGAAGLAAKGRRRTYSGSFVDFDGDGDLDLLNVSDFAGLDLYRNNGQGRFTDITEQLGDTRFSFGMSHVLGDFNGDAKMDLYMTGMGSTTARRLENMGAGRAEHAAHQVHRMKMGYGNRLFFGGAKGLVQSPHNDEVSRAGWCWGVTGADFDLDGDRDIFVANGHLSRESAKDHCTVFWRHDIFTNNSTDNAVMSRFFSEHNQQQSGESWNGFEHNVFYLNDGTGRFVNVAFLLGISHEFDSRMVVGADLNQNGRPDLVVVELRRTPKGPHAREVVHIIRNDWPTRGNWIGVQLRGAPGVSPLGAVVEAVAGDRTWSQPVVSGDSLWAQHPFTVHFGLGETKAVDTLRIRWPDGRATVLEQPQPNQYHTVTPEPSP